MTDLQCACAIPASENMIIFNMAAGSAGEPGPPPCKVGDIVSCKNCLEVNIEGEVLAYDPTSRLLALSILLFAKCDLKMTCAQSRCTKAKLVVLHTQLTCIHIRILIHFLESQLRFCVAAVNMVKIHQN